MKGWAEVRLCSLVLALAPGALAGHRLEVQRVAFNPAGTQVLMVAAGQLDGSGFSAAALQVVDTASGQTLRRANFQSSTLEVPQAVTALLRREETALRRWQLWPGRTSTPVFRRRFPVRAPAWSEGVQAGSQQTVWARVWSRPLPVKLNVFPLLVRCAYGDQLPAGEGPAGVALRINGQPLVQDRTLSVDRQCAARYALERLDVQGNRVAAVLRVYTPGFEGPNAEPLLVAGQLR
ncbi:DUF2259 domain-containing protein [Deinococcus navajonensis]|uniref:DUF2259 domain-containing protein n=1 Tax=Deinococcus navajonensis TaxID=309884 RepID=A0ABV8XM98_9DEIO